MHKSLLVPLICTICMFFSLTTQMSPPLPLRVAVLCIFWFLLVRHFIVSPRKVVVWFCFSYFHCALLTSVFFCFWSLFQWYCFLKFDLSRPPYNNHWVESSSCFRNHYVVTIQKTVRFYFRLLNVIVISSYTPCYIIRTFVVLTFLIPGRSTDNSWTQYQPILPSASS